MNRTELEKHLALVENQISACKEAFAAAMAVATNERDHIAAQIAAIEPEAVKEWPQNGDGICCVLACGDIAHSHYDESSGDWDAVAIGNVFRTEALALRRVEALKVAAELRRMPGRCAAPDGGPAKFCIDFDAGRFRVLEHHAPSFCSIAIAGVWFATKDAAQHALDTIGQDRFAVYLADFLDEPMGDE